MKEKGIIVKIKGAKCIVLTAGGLYQKVPLSSVGKAVVGAQIEITPVRKLSFMKPMLLAASILIVLLGFNLYRMVLPPTAFAYVSLDINPSVELKVDKDLKVIDVSTLNDDAVQLVSGLQITGKDLYSSITDITEAAAKMGFLKSGQKNYILSSVTVNTTENTVNFDAVAQHIKTSVNNKGLDTEIVVLSTTKKTRENAKSNGVSAGKYEVYQEAVAAGKKLTIQEVKKNSITNLVKSHRLQIVPRNKKTHFKEIHVESDYRPLLIEKDLEEHSDKNKGIGHTLLQDKNQSLIPDKTSEKKDREVMQKKGSNKESMMNNGKDAKSVQLKEIQKDLKKQEEIKKAKELKREQELRREKALKREQELKREQALKREKAFKREQALKKEKELKQKEKLMEQNSPKTQDTTKTGTDASTENSDSQTNKNPDFGQLQPDQNNTEAG